MVGWKKYLTLRTMYQGGVVPIFYHVDEEVCLETARGVQRGGCRVLEFTNRGAGALQVFRSLVQACKNEEWNMVLGAGTVMDAATAALFIEAGADFIVSPVLHEDSIRTCNRCHIPCIPGCSTATEINRAHEWGVDVCKLFPAAALGGIPFLKAIRGPMPWTQIIPMGGISLEHIGAWIEAGAFCVGMGSTLIPPAALEQGDYEQVTDRVGRAVEAVKVVRAMDSG